MSIDTMLQMVIPVNSLVHALEILDRSKSFQLSIHHTSIETIQDILTESVAKGLLSIPEVLGSWSDGDVDTDNHIYFWIDFSSQRTSETLHREFWDEPRDTRLRFRLQSQLLGVSPWQEPTLVLFGYTPFTSFSFVDPFVYNVIKPLLRELIPIISPLFLNTITDISIGDLKLWELDAFQGYKPWLQNNCLYILGDQFLHKVLDHPDFSIRDLEGLGKYYLCNVTGSSYLWIEHPFGIGNERVPDEIHKQYPRNEHRVALQQLISKYLC